MSTKTINKLDTIIAMADSLKSMATGLRKELAPFQVPAPKRGKGLSPEQEAQLISRRRKNINKSITQR
jgi:hypothetical protein